MGLRVNSEAPYQCLRSRLGLTTTLRDEQGRSYPSLTGEELTTSSGRFSDLLVSKTTEPGHEYEVF